MDSYEEQKKIVAKHGDIMKQNQAFSAAAIKASADNSHVSAQEVEIGRKGFEAVYNEFHALLKCPSCKRKALDADEEPEDDDDSE